MAQKESEFDLSFRDNNLMVSVDCKLKVVVHPCSLCYLRRWGKHKGSDQPETDQDRVWKQVF